MKVYELIELLKGKENYNISVDYNDCALEIEVDDEEEIINFLIDEDSEELEECDEEYDDEGEENIPELSEFLEHYYDFDDLIKLANYLNISSDDLENIDNDNDEEIIKLILECNEDIVKEACIDLFGNLFDNFVDDYEINNAWRHSNYESKNIEDWSVDDHLAAHFDHIMEK